jgi:hypothetical protein
VAPREGRGEDPGAPEAGGAFAATTTALSGTLTLEGAKPARLVGDVSMDLTTIDTGIALRNQHLKENYLEVAKGDGFNKAVLSDIQLADASGETFDGPLPSRAPCCCTG